MQVDDEAHETWRQYAKDAWFHVRIVMSPAAYQRNPETPAELWELLRHLLELLVALHREGLVHRDLRLPNVYRFGDSWLVSDWELAAPAGLQVPYKIKRLPEDVKSGREVYTYRHDLWQVGIHVSVCLGYTPSCQRHDSCASPQTLSLRPAIMR